MKTGTTVSSQRALRAILPTPPAAIAHKKVPGLELATDTFLAKVSFVGVVGRDGSGAPSVTARMGEGGAPKIAGERTLMLSDSPAARLGGELESALGPGGVGLVCLIPGVPETLRINGDVQPCDEEGWAKIDVSEVYFHCPKAFLRAQLWAPRESLAPLPGSAAGVRERLDSADVSFLEGASFALLGTHDGDGGFDLSPRGDPGGLLRILDDRTLFLPDRPGNRIADSLRNILATGEAALLALVPGRGQSLRVQARAEIVTDPALLEPAAEKGRAPKLGVRLDVRTVSFEDGPALGQSAMWDPGRHTDPKSLPSLGELLLQQLDPNGRGRRVKTFFLDRMMKRDAAKNLY
ncbi:MAG: pyridoxamine 5'-phosphate oxidase family protein [Candidatus Binatia bacterium]|nr:pyridoxamine 5'-phosphate oxidase family protein [Candidatus Binatia bacterium]